MIWITVSAILVLEVQTVRGNADRSMDQKRVVSCVFRNRDLALLIVEVGIRGIIGNCAKRIGASAGSGKPHFPSLLSRPEGGYVVFLTFGVDENHVQFDLVEWIGVRFP